MNKEIQLHSRGKLNNKLIQTEDNPLKYKLKSEFPYRVGFDDKGNYTFIDPAGGPFITIGSEIDGHVVIDIDKDCIIEFKS